MDGVLGKFEGYTLRAIDESDYVVLEKWIAADPKHAGVLDPEFFMGQVVDGEGRLAEDPRASVFALCDRKNVLMYIRLARASRVHIQFAPEPEADNSGEQLKAQRRHKTEMANALIKGMAFLEVGLERAGCSEWIFETVSPELRNITVRRMAFKASQNEMVRVIPRREA